MQVRRGADLQSSEGETEVSAPDEPKVRRYKVGLNGTAFMGMLECHELHHGPEFAPDSYGEFVSASDYDALHSRLEAVLRAADAMATDLEWYASEGKQMFYLVNGTKLRADFTSRAREALAAYRDATSAEKEGT